RPYTSKAGRRAAPTHRRLAGGPPLHRRRAGGPPLHTEGGPEGRPYTPKAGRRAAPTHRRLAGGPRGGPEGRPYIEGGLEGRPHTSKRLARKGRREQPTLALRIQLCHLLDKQRIGREFVVQRSQQFAGVLLIVFADVGNREKDVGERRQVMPAVSDQLQLLNARLLVSGKPAQAHQPAHRRRHAADQILADSAGDVRVITVGI